MFLYTMLVCFVVAVTCVYWLLKRYFDGIYSVFKDVGIKGPGTVWFLGSSLEMKRAKSPLHAFQKWYKQYGPVFGYYEGMKASMCVSDPALIHEILGTHFHKFQDRTYCVPVVCWPENRNIMHLVGPDWKKARSIIAPAFNDFNTALMLGDICQKSEELIKQLEDYVDLDDMDICDLFDRYAIDSFALATFGVDLGSLADPHEATLNYIRSYYSTGDVDNKLTGLTRLFPILKPIKYLCMGEYRGLLRENLKQTKHLIHTMTSSEDSSRSHHKVMEKLLEATGSGKRRNLTERELLEQVNSIMGSGFGQTNSLLAFCAHTLAVRPDIQDKLRVEVHREVGIGETEVGMEELSQLTYMTMFLEETLRMYPIAPGVTRLCSETCTINGVTIKKGTIIRALFCNMYTDPEIYPNPDIFDPLRFSPEEKAKRHPQTWLGFGYGPRMCVGYKLGIMQCKVALVHILQKFVVQRSPATKDELETSLRPMLVPKNGVHIMLKPHNKGAWHMAREE